MAYVIEKIENGIAVLEEMNNHKNNELVVINVQLLPNEAKEGDIIQKDGKLYFINNELTNKRLNNLTERMRNLFKK